MNMKHKLSFESFATSSPKTESPVRPQPHWANRPEAKFVLLFSRAALELRAMGYGQVADVSMKAGEMMAEIVDKLDG